jgi:hypothetical protein
MRMARWSILAAAVLLWIAAAAACGGGSSPSSDGDSSTPEPTPSPAVPVTPSAETSRFRGETIDFSYPDNWFIWVESWDGHQEHVVVANLPKQDEDAELPSGSIKIDFTGGPAQPHEALPGEVTDTFRFQNVRFTLRKIKEEPWRLTGSFKIGGINWTYVADIRINTEEAQVEMLQPLLESWVIGSTNHHPIRSCIPGECP